MPRSQSALGLGKGRNPLRCCTGDLGALPLSPDEQEAERLYYALISASLTKQTFSIAKDLTRKSPDAGAYLTWLIYRCPKWPQVAPSEVKMFRFEFLVRVPVV